MENILNINLETQTAPIVREAMGKKWIEYGTEDWSNLYPQFLIDLYYNSSTHAAIVNATSDMIAGESFIVEDSENLDAYVRLKKFLSGANSSETMHEVFKKCAFDFKLQGAYALNVIWSKDKTRIAEVHHIPVERIRIGIPNELGQIDTYFVSADWSNIRKNPPLPVPAFNMNNRADASQIIYDGLYSPSMHLYKTPDYVSGCNWAMIDQKVAEFHLSNIQNGFSGSYFISFANGVPSQEERLQIERSLAKKFTGAKASGKFVLTFSDDKNRTPEITPIAVSNADKQYLALQELLVQNILTAHRVTSPMLMGIRSDSGLGNNAQEMTEAYEIYANAVVKPFQEHLLNCFKKILDINDINLPISIQQFKPITSKFTVEDMKEVMTQDEIREELGLAPLEDEDFTVEEEDRYNMSEEKDELDFFLEEHGEEIPEEWELVHEEDAEGEDSEFDFETELNKIATERVELASTGQAKPDNPSEQDGISKKTYDYFRVRYVYAEDDFLKRKKSGNSRSFCKRMLSANKLYRKEDIAPKEDGGQAHSLSNRPVNKGWGLKGANTYDVFKYKGGGNCHHFWLRQIYKTQLGIDVSTKIDDAELIGYTKARSEGFTAKKNPSEVAKPPKRMPKKGFVNK
jgi:hypothetical protein